MDKIFSRKRFRFHIINCSENNDKALKYKKIKKISTIAIIAIITIYTLISKINPVFNTLCIEKSKAITTQIINTESNKSFKNIGYEDLVETIKENNRKYKYAKNKYGFN